MQTLRLKPEEVDRAAEILRRGGLVAFPTETVYGLGAHALDAAAVRSIFVAKERPAWDPVIVHLADPEDFAQVAEVPAGLLGRVRAFIPGPLTLLLPKRDVVPDVVTAGRERVGVRVPQQELARELIRRAGVPVAAPSANRFGSVSPTTADHVLADLDGRIDVVLDGGPTRVGVESTVLDPLASPPLILRLGGVSREQLEAVFGQVEIYQPPARSESPPESLPSPGVGIRHYAPRARVVLAEPTAEAVALAVAEQAEHAGKVGLLLPSGWPTAIHGSPIVFDWGRWGDWEALAQRLYAGMRALDAAGVEVIVAPLTPDEGLGRTLRDRLSKATLTK